MIASSEGGMDIEGVAHDTPEKIITEIVDPALGLTDAQAKKLADAIGVPATSTARAVDVLQKSTRSIWTPTPAWLKSTP